MKNGRPGADCVLLALCLSLLIRVPRLSAFPLFEWRGEGASATGLGRCSILIDDDGFSGMNNPARAGEAGILTISVSATSPYGVPGLFLGTAWISRGWSGLGAGAGFSTYGDGIYREERFTVGAARRVPGFSLGTQFSANRVSIEDLGARSFASVSFGFFWRGGGGVRLACVLRDAASVGDDLRRELRATAAVSAAVELPRTVTVLYLELRGTSGQFATASLGLESKLLGPVSFRMGMGRNPSLFSVGLGVRLDFLRMDLGVEEHLDLGQTRSGAITFLPSGLSH